ncbi:tRNA pseudouridine(38-40) synthase TruA [Persicobacter diffluens]|uniref:tRNA pseudouridine synthase A n=1 Tax=Persicobacter diffluens TaxID=981 RepID=A0AAN5AKJ7_9BACT|nr:tRNA pseudouridine synthase A [Persicobacter diffluens]
MFKNKRYYYLLELQYLGFRYHGWQKQPGVKTVQGMVERTLRYIFQHDDFKILAAGRTDAMVSANHAAVELFVWETLEEEEFLAVLNENLPQDIRALSVEQVDEKFNVIQGSKWKEYIYLFSYGAKNHPFAAPYMVNVPEELNIEAMKAGAKLFQGEHNFQKFCYKPSADTVFVRTVEKSEVVENDVYTANFFPEKSFLFRAVGKGFARHQIRLMMGALFALGKGKITLEQLEKALEGGDNQPISYIAPASGLMLQSIQFD